MVNVLNLSSGYVAKNMSYGAVDLFTSWMCGHQIHYTTYAGETLSTVDVKFTDQRAIAWIDMFNSGYNPCPFCGGIPEIRHRTECGGHGEFYKTAQVTCTECGAGAKSVIIDGYYGAETTEQDAIDAWNRRVY